MIDSLSLAHRFDASIGRQLDLCRALEGLADALPTRVDTHAAMRLADRLHPTLRRSRLLEETMIFPVLMISRRDIGPILERLHTEHLEDEDHAGDIRDAVGRFVIGQARRGRKENGEELGYMLRGLFTSLRRHVAFDRDYVLPLYRDTCGL